MSAFQEIPLDYPIVRQGICEAIRGYPSIASCADKVSFHQPLQIISEPSQYQGLEIEYQKSGGLTAEAKTAASDRKIPDGNRYANGLWRFPAQNIQQNAAGQSARYVDLKNDEDPDRFNAWKTFGNSIQSSGSLYAIEVCSGNFPRKDQKSNAPSLFEGQSCSRQYHTA